MVVKEEEEEEERREEDEQEEEVAFVPTSRAQLDAVCHFFTFLPSPFRALLSSCPFSPFLFVSPSFPVRASVTPSPSRPSLSLLPRLYLSSPLSFSLYLFPFARVYPLPRLMPFVSGKRD